MANFTRLTLWEVEGRYDGTASESGLPNRERRRIQELADLIWAGQSMRRNPIWKASANRREHPKTRGEGTYAQMVNESGDEIGKEVK